MPNQIFKLLFKTIDTALQGFYDVFVKLARLSPKHTNMMSKEVAADSGVIAYTKFLLAIFLIFYMCFSLYILIFGWFPPTGETISIWQYSFEDYLLNDINNAISVLFSIVIITWIPYINFVNERKGTLAYWTRQAEKQFK